MATTKSAAYTPGPWRAIWRGAAGWTIASANWVVRLLDANVTREDAALIAAAPDLLAALRVIAEADHPDSPVGRGPVTEHEFAERLMRVARAALARAEGRS